MEIIMNLEKPTDAHTPTQPTHNLVVGRMVIHQRYRNTQLSQNFYRDPKPNQL